MDRCQVAFETLVDYHEGRLDTETSERIREHLKGGCADCQEAMAWLARAMPGLRPAAALLHAPERVQSRARTLFREHRKASRRRTLLARLVFDSRADPAPALARGEQNTAIQRLYSTDEHDVDLWEERVTDTESYLIGQIYRKEGGDALTPDQVTLTDADGATLSADADAGEFHLPSVGAGTYALRLSLPDSDILLPDIQIGGEAHP